LYTRHGREGRTLTLDLRALRGQSAARQGHRGKVPPLLLPSLRTRRTQAI